MEKLSRPYEVNHAKVKSHKPRCHRSHATNTLPLITHETNHLQQNDWLRIQPMADHHLQWSFVIGHHYYLCVNRKTYVMYIYHGTKHDFLDHLCKAYLKYIVLFWWAIVFDFINYKLSTSMMVTALNSIHVLTSSK